MRASSSSIQIYQARTQHCDGLGKLHFRNHTETFKVFAAPEWIKRRKLGDYTQYWCEYLQSQPQTEFTWVAVYKKHIVGTVTLKPLINCGLEFVPRGTCHHQISAVACLRLMYVAPDHLSNGIGSQLMQHLLGYMTSQNYTIGTLITHQANTRARKFYERNHWIVDECFSHQVTDFFWEPPSMRKRVRYRINLRRTQSASCS